MGLDLVLGDPPDRFHPVAWLGRALALGRRGLCRGPRSRLFLGGAAVTLVVAAVAGAGAVAVSALAVTLGPLRVVLEGIVLKSMLSLRGLVAAGERVARDLDGGDIEAARRAVGRDLVSRSTRSLSAEAVASATIESVAENLTDGFVAPICFFLAFGLGGAVVYRAINTADSMFGYREGALEHFGKVAARLDDVLNLIPARLAAGALVLGAAWAGADARRAFATLRRDRGLTESPNAGWTMAAMAGALGVVLEKRAAYRLGEGRDPGPADVRRSLRVMIRAAMLALAAALLARVLIPAIPSYLALR